MYCKYVAGIGEIELDMAIFEHHIVCITEITQGTNMLNTSTVQNIAIASGIGKI